MKHHSYLLLLSFTLFTTTIYAQLKDSLIQNVIVETYYIADAKDAADTTYGKLEEGAVTYRVYVDLSEGCKLKKIYGSSAHRLKIKSTEKQSGKGIGFFNNTDRGKSFGKDITTNTLRRNTVALDTWLTLGAASSTYFGILKADDKDGSVLKTNSDSLLKNTNSALGIPLTVSDGLANLASPSGWYHSGIIDPITNVDSTIFGSVKPGSEFISTAASLNNNSGVAGPAASGNRILVAQLTTKGQLSFELNLEVIDGNGNTINFVAKKDSLSSDEDTLYSPYLTYPRNVVPCGCMDHNYIEYNKKFTCSKAGACKTLVVLGCTDKNACNYNPDANVQIPNFCCYPGYCADRDIAIVCPNLSVHDLNRSIRLEVYPNPVQGDELTIKVAARGNNEIKYALYDSFGRIIIEKAAGVISDAGSRQIDVTDLAKGVYLLRLFMAGSSVTKVFIKN